MPYYSNTPLQQNYNTSTQQNLITPMLQYVIMPFPDLGRHFSTYFLIYYTLCFLTL